MVEMRGRRIGWYGESYRHYLAAKGIKTRRVVKKGKVHLTRSGQEVRQLAQRVKQRLRPCAERIEIAGSIRRKVENPVDVDIVLIPKQKECVQQKMHQMADRIEAEGNSTIQARIQGVDVDIYYAEPGNFGAQLLRRTGPYGANIGNSALAKRKGLLLNQYGVFEKKTGKKLAGRTEEEVYKALGKTWRPPEERGTVRK